MHARPIPCAVLGDHLRPFHLNAKKHVAPCMRNPTLSASIQLPLRIISLRPGIGVPAPFLCSNIQRQSPQRSVHRLFPRLQPDITHFWGG